MTRLLVAAAMVVSALVVPVVAGASHSPGKGKGSPHDFVVGSLKSTIVGLGEDHVRFSAHLPAVQPPTGSFDGHGHVVLDWEYGDAERQKVQGDLLCGSVETPPSYGGAISIGRLLFRLRETYFQETFSGFEPVDYIGLFVLDNRNPAQSDLVAWAFYVFPEGQTPEETGVCPPVGGPQPPFDPDPQGNAVVHDA